MTVKTAFSISASADVDGFTIRNGNNAAKIGGAIFSGHYGKLTISDCTFTENSAFRGGGIYIGNNEHKISNCVITKNTASYYGGGFATIGNVTFESRDITNNTAGNCGAGLYFGYGTQTLTSCDISGNVISGDGSGYDTGFKALSGVMALVMAGLLVMTNKKRS